MKEGRSLTALATELERQSEAKRDFVADTRRVSMIENEDHSSILSLADGNGGQTFPLTPVCHDQLATRLGIPAKYYDRMLEKAPDLLRDNVNTWLHDDPKKVLVRTLDGNARAFLSDRYRPLDNFDLAQAILPTLLDSSMGFTIESCELTERRMYLKVLCPKIQGEIKVGNVVQAGIVISNSEIGFSSVKVEQLVYELICKNGMITANSLKRHHVGKSQYAGLDFEIAQAQEIFTDATRQADDRAFWMKVRDVVKAAFNEQMFQETLERHKASVTREITKDPVEVVEVTAKRFGFNDAERSGILTNLIKGADLTQYGLAQAVTRMAQDVESYDRSIEMERIGSTVIELEQNDWKVLAA
jgi:hypothetical protein